MFFYHTKVFDQVWHERFLFKLEEYRGKGKILHLPNNYLERLRQGYDQTGVPQGSHTWSHTASKLHK